MNILDFLTSNWPVFAILGAFYAHHRDIKSDISKFEERMEKIDERWVTLLSEIHRLDKDVTVLKVNKS